MRISLLLVALSVSGCTDDDAAISVETSERSVERRIDGDSPRWAAAPILIEGPFVCPLPAEAFAQPLATAHETFEIRNAGAATSLEIRLEGRSFDAGLTAEPLLLVYSGAQVPDTATAAANCLDISKPGGGEPGSVVVPVASGGVITAVALEYEIGPGIDGSGSGTFRLRVIPSL